MVKVTKLSNGCHIEFAGVSSSIYDSEAWDLLLQLAAALGLGEIPLGMLHILKAEGPHCTMSADHDQIWYGNGDSEISASDSSIAMGQYMTVLGWFIDELVDCWSHGV